MAMLEFFKTPLTQTTLYLAISMGVALAIFIQIVILKANKGKYPNSALFSLLSTLDSLWIFASIAGFFWLDLLGLVVVIPVFYVIYTVMGFVYAGHTMNDGKGMPTRPEDLVFADNYLNFAQSFSIAFFLACGVFLASLYYPVPYLSQFYAIP